MRRSTTLAGTISSSPLAIRAEIMRYEGEVGIATGGIRWTTKRAEPVAPPRS